MAERPDLSTLPGLLAAEDWPAAGALLRAAAAQDGASAEVFYNLGKVLEAAGRHAEAGPWFERAVSARPDYQIAWFELGRWAIAHGPLQRALDAFRAASQIDANDEDAARNHARLALRLGHWQEAERVWSRFSDPEALMAHYRTITERGEDGSGLRDELLARGDLRPDMLKAMTRTARGRIPLTPPALCPVLARDLS